MIPTDTCNTGILILRRDGLHFSQFSFYYKKRKRLLPFLRNSTSKTAGSLTISKGIPVLLIIHCIVPSSEISATSAAKAAHGEAGRSGGSHLNRLCVCSRCDQVGFILGEEIAVQDG